MRSFVAQTRFDITASAQRTRSASELADRMRESSIEDSSLMVCEGSDAITVGIAFVDESRLAF
jgi:hypothetical protein